MPCSMKEAPRRGPRNPLRRRRPAGQMCFTVVKLMDQVFDAAVPLRLVTPSLEVAQALAVPGPLLITESNVAAPWPVVSTAMPQKV